MLNDAVGVCMSNTDVGCALTCVILYTDLSYSAVAVVVDIVDVLAKQTERGSGVQPTTETAHGCVDDNLAHG